MTTYQLVHAPALGTFKSATETILAGMLAGLSGELLTWIAG